MVFLCATPGQHFVMSNANNNGIYTTQYATLVGISLTYEPFSLDDIGPQFSTSILIKTFFIVIKDCPFIKVYKLDLLIYTLKLDSFL